jgi:hypothetical protein
MRRWPVIALLVLGLGLVATPVAAGWFGPAYAGHRVMEKFKPLMTDRSVHRSRLDLNQMKGLQGDLAPVVSTQSIEAMTSYLTLVRQAVDESKNGAVSAYLGTLGNTSPLVAGAAFRQKFPANAKLADELVGMSTLLAPSVSAMQKNAEFLRALPAIVAFTESQVTAMEASRDDFWTAAGLDSRIIPWAFVGVGALIMVLSGAMLLPRRRAVEEAVASPQQMRDAIAA